MLKKSPLHAVHRALGARFVSHGGWEVPVNFGSVTAEHHAVRRDCGMFDVSWLTHLDIQGPDTRKFLLRLLANDIDRLDRPGKSLYTTMLNDDGGVMDDLIVHRLDYDRYRLIIDADRSDRDLAWIKTCQHIWKLDVTLSLLGSDSETFATIAIQGPSARSKVWDVLPEIRPTTIGLTAYSSAQVESIFVATTGYTGEDGFEITLPANRAEALWYALMAVGVKPCGFCARDTLRTEAGLRLYGRDMDEMLSPFEAGLAWSVETTSERDFIGRNALFARAQRWQFLGLKLVDKGLLRDRQTVFTEHGEGKITSATYSPTLEAYIALVLLPREIAIGDIVHASLRGHPLPAQVTPPRFVRHGKVLLSK